MIGKTIDRAVLTALGAAGLYLFFLNAGLGIVGSCALTFVCMALLRQVIRGIPVKRGATKRQAEAALLSIALMAEEDAREALIALTGQADIIPVLRHPEGVFTVDMLYELWREHGDGVRVVVTCSPEGKAGDFAKERSIDLIDREKLVKRIQKTGLYVPRDAPKPPLRSRLRPLWERPIKPRVLIAVIGLMLTYLTAGHVMCLICALGLTGFTGARLIEKMVP